MLTDNSEKSASVKTCKCVAMFMLKHEKCFMVSKMDRFDHVDHNSCYHLLGYNVLSIVTVCQRSHSVIFNVQLYL